jgi:hypothetical protein
MTDPSQVTIMSLGWPGWLSLGLVVLCFVLFIRTRIAPDIVTSGALTLLLISGVLTPHEALAGFSNPGMLTVAVLYVVVTGLTETGAVGWIGQSLLGRPRGEHAARARLMLPVAALSAFLNNTPVVAIFIPAVQDWAKRYRLSLSRLLIPLSYASIAGGTCTLIGTSTNLVWTGSMPSASAALDWVCSSLPGSACRWWPQCCCSPSLPVIVSCRRVLRPRRATRTCAATPPRCWSPPTAPWPARASRPPDCAGCPACS